MFSVVFRLDNFHSSIFKFTYSSIIVKLFSVYYIIHTHIHIYTNIIYCNLIVMFKHLNTMLLNLFSDLFHLFHFSVIEFPFVLFFNSFCFSTEISSPFLIKRTYSFTSLKIVIIIALNYSFANYNIWSDHHLF